MSSGGQATEKETGSFCHVCWLFCIPRRHLDWSFSPHIPEQKMSVAAFSFVDVLHHPRHTFAYSFISAAFRLLEGAEEVEIPGIRPEGHNRISPFAKD